MSTEQTDKMKNTGEKKQGIYHGWWLVLTCFMLMALVLTPGVNLNHLFIVPISEELGVSRTAVTAIVTFVTVISMVASVFAGKILAKKDIKKKMIIATIIFALAMIGRGLLSNLWGQYLMSAISGAATIFLTSIPISILLNNWFGPKMRGRAMGIAMVGSSFGGLLLSPVIGYINENISWKISFILIGVLALVVVLPLIAFTISFDPSEKGLKRMGDEDAEAAAGGGTTLTGLTSVEAKKTPMYWLAFLTFTMYSIITIAYVGVFSPYFTDIGFSVTQAASFYAIYSVIIMISKVLLGFINDKIGTLKSSVIAIIFILCGLSLTIVAANSVNMSVPSVVFMGIGLSLATVMLPLITAHLFGNRDYGAIVGIMNIGSALGGAIGPFGASLIFDYTGSYVNAWYVCVVIGIVMLITTIVIHKMRNKLSF